MVDPQPELRRLAVRAISDLVQAQVRQVVGWLDSGLVEARVNLFDRSVHSHLINCIFPAWTGSILSSPVFPAMNSSIKHLFGCFEKSPVFINQLALTCFQYSNFSNFQPKEDGDVDFGEIEVQKWLESTRKIHLLSTLQILSPITLHSWIDLRSHNLITKICFPLCGKWKRLPTLISH